MGWPAGLASFAPNLLYAGPFTLSSYEGRWHMADTDKYQCSVCGWMYDPAVGDPDGGIAPGTPFSKIADSWRCPVCGAEKSAFEKA